MTHDHRPLLRHTLPGACVEICSCGMARTDDGEWTPPETGLPVSVTEAALLLGVSPSTIRQACQRGEIGTREGARWSIERTELWRWAMTPTGKAPIERRRTR